MQKTNSKYYYIGKKNMLRKKIFDSCIYPENYNFQSIKKLSVELDKNNISLGLCMSKPDTNLKKFYLDVSKFKNLIPVASLKNKKTLNNN